MRLDRRDVVLLLEAATAIGQVERPEDFAEELCRQLHSVVAAIATSYVEWDVVTGEWIAAVNPLMIDDPDHQAIAATYIHEHPVEGETTHARESAVAISDRATTREYHQTNIYNLYYRPSTVEDQLLTRFQVGCGRFVILAASRDRRGFSERDRTALELLTPHVARGYRLARDRAELRRRMAALERASDEGGRGVIVLDASGAPALVSSGARRQLERVLDGQLRNVLERLVPADGGRRRANRKVIKGNQDRLVARFLPGLSDDQADAILIDSGRHAPAEEAMAALGLTSREAEVIAAVADGLTNREIASRLVLSERTVESHLAHVYDKLGVSSRTGAVARVLDAQ